MPFRTGCSGALANLQVVILAATVIQCGRAVATEPPATLRPSSSLEVAIGAASTSHFAVDLPPGTAADLRLIQRSGFVDLELNDSFSRAIRLRTESGIGGQSEAPLLASASGHWKIILATRAGKGASSATLILSPLRPAVPRDARRSAAFEHYVEAEELRFANFKESRVTARSAATEQRTRADYAAAEADYLAADDPCGVRRARIGLARMEIAIGDYEAGRSEAESALQATCEDGPAEQAEALKTIGMAAAYQADYTASADAAEKAVAIYRQTGDVRFQGVELGNLSDVYMRLGETDRALAAANGSLQSALSTADARGIVFSRESIAAIHLARGELAEALRDYRQTLSELTATPYPMIEAETWNDLGIVYHRMGDYPQSLEAYGQAQRVWARMKDHFGHADTLINQAEALLESGSTSSAIHSFKDSLRISRADGLKELEANALRGLGTVHATRGELPAARGYFQQSLDLARAIGARAAQSYALRDLGDLDYRGGQLPSARRNAEAALDQARQAADLDGEAATLELLARIRADAGELVAGRKLIEQALDIIETQHGQINDPSLRTNYFAAMRRYPDTQIQILMRLDARYPNQGYAEAALSAAERARARSFKDMLLEKSIDLSHALAPAIADEQKVAQEHLNAAAVQYARSSRDASAERQRMLANAVDAANRTLDEIRGRIRATNARYAGLVQPADLRVADLQARFMKEDTGVLEYWLGAHESYLWIVQRHSLRVFRLPSRTLIERLNRNLQDLCGKALQPTASSGLEGLAAAGAQRNDEIREAATLLATAVLPRATLQDLPSRLVIVPDAGLRGTPFGLLPEGEDERTLGATHELAYLPSISTLEWLRRPTRGAERRTEKVAIVAAPQVDSTAFPPLPYARIEAQSIAALLPKAQVWLALGAEASRSNVLSANWRGFTLAHFAAHATIDRNRPELSGIVLSAPRIGGEAHDGILRVNDIYNLDMPLDLVVLSGCATATGQELDSEGVFGLSRAFFYAGAAHVVASLWPVDDRATAEFMSEFYRALIIEHSTAANALRTAQRYIAGDARWASPYYWAAFVLQGDWD